MAPRVLIPGGYGVFGRLLAREVLATTDAHVVVAGRNEAKAAATCAALGPRARPLTLDLRDLDAVGGAARGCAMVACAAGPFQDLARALPEVVASSGAHWLDIADDAGWVVPVLQDRATNEIADRAGRAVLPGLSSVPLVAMALARACVARAGVPVRIEAALFIGNRNPKGAGSIASALRTGFGDARAVSFPFGRRLAYRFSSSFESLAAGAFGVPSEFRVTLGSALAGRFVHAAGPLARALPGDVAARSLALAARPLSVFGADAGAVLATATGGDGATASFALVGGGQRLAILPCAIAVQELLGGRTARGAIEASTWLEPGEWIRRLRARGLRLYER